MNTNLLEVVLDHLYTWNAQYMNLYIHLDIESIINLICVNKYFEKHKRMLYNIVISKIPHLIQRPIPLMKLYRKIKSNHYLRKKTYIINKYRRFIQYYITLERRRRLLQDNYSTRDVMLETKHTKSLNIHSFLPKNHKKVIFCDFMLSFFFIHSKPLTKIAGKFFKKKG